MTPLIRGLGKSATQDMVACVIALHVFSQNDADFQELFLTIKIVLYLEGRMTENGKERDLASSWLLLR